MTKALALISITLFCSSVCSDRRISHGVPMPLDEVPFIVALFYNDVPRCGGSLITEDFVLTAAHCFKCQNSPTCETKKFSVLIGTGQLEDGSGMRRKVVRKYTHPCFDTLATNNFEYDFGLLLLEHADELPENVGFAKLPSFFQTPEEGTLMTVSGWGATESEDQSSVLLSTQIPVYNHEHCKTYFFNTLRYVINDKMICVGYLKGNTNSCHGDSGGPLVGTSDGILYGVVSFGSGSCEYPGLVAYAKVSAALDWIEAITNGSYYECKNEN